MSGVANEARAPVLEEENAGTGVEWARTRGLAEAEAGPSGTAGDEAAVRQQIGRMVRAHATAWWLAGNGVGVGLAACLLWPNLLTGIAPLSYGRWMPLHLNWLLYGWAALPLVGALLGAGVRPDAQGRRHARVVLGMWSAALTLGGLSWLGGEASGKLFLDWSGWARPLLPLAMSALWTVLAAHAWTRRYDGWSRATRVGWTLLLLLLLPVPGLLYFATDRRVFPAVNPDSGGATGTSLLGSTLGIVVIFALLPRLLGVRRKGGGRAAESGRADGGRRAWVFLGALGVSWVVFALLEHGAVSHHAAAQIVGLGVLLAWVPLLVWWMRGYAWPEPARPWLRAAGWWWAVLVLSGWVTFLPEVAERAKFTHLLVAHAHLAMAGLVTSVNVAVLALLDGRKTARWAWAWWQGGCVAQVVVLALLGAREAEAGADLFYGAGWVDALFAVRLGAGIAMLVGAVGVAWPRVQRGVQPGPAEVGA